MKRLQDGAAGEEGRQYIILLAAACSRDEDDLLDFQLAHHLGYDVYTQRFAHFDDLVRVERVRRGLDSSPEDRAAALLLENLSKLEREQYKYQRYFDVTGGESGKRYRIWHRTMQNIEELDACGEHRFIWCVHPAGVPLCDRLLAQKIALELFECETLRIANRYAGWNPAQQEADPLASARTAALANYRAVARAALQEKKQKSKWRRGLDALKHMHTSSLRAG